MGRGKKSNGLSDFALDGGGQKQKGRPEGRPIRMQIRLSSNYIMPSMPMPPMPPGIAGASFFGSSAIMASVVTSRPATEAAS